MAYLYGESKDVLLARLRRIEGQVRGIARMVEDDKYCVDVMNQISAATAGLEKVGLHLLSAHIRGCVREAVATEEGEEKVDELLDVVERFVKA
ncbi:MAG: metal-sensitive transcriptional regulator [Actinomycetota bacterium]|nr:metal-sensitive transcriptional regulator [Actinomycetota bacterium]